MCSLCKYYGCKKNHDLLIQAFFRWELFLFHSSLYSFVSRSLLLFYPRNLPHFFFLANPEEFSTYFYLHRQVIQHKFFSYANDLLKFCHLHFFTSVSSVINISLNQQSFAITAHIQLVHLLKRLAFQN